MVAVESWPCLPRPRPARAGEQGKGHEPFQVDAGWCASQAPQSHNTRFARRKAKGRRGEKGKRRKKEQMSSVWFAWHWLVNSRTTETLLSASPLLAANPRTERSSDDVSACSTRESNPFDRREWGSKPGPGSRPGCCCGPAAPGRYRERASRATHHQRVIEVQVGNLQSGARCELGRTTRVGLQPEECLLSMLALFLALLPSMCCFLRCLLLFAASPSPIAKHSHRRLLLCVQSATHIGRHGGPEGTSRTSAGLGPSTQDGQRLDARICSMAKSTARTVRTSVSAPAERGLGWGP